MAIFLSVAYNLELFHGAMHTDFVVCVAWGSWSLATGYVFSHGANVVILSLLMLMGYFVCSVEINASRPYRAMKGNKPLPASELYKRYELVLMSIVGLIVSLTLLLIASTA